MIKHSYLINKEIIFCILAEDRRFFYGEILYGTKKIDGVKTILIDNIKYYKYWQLSDRKNKGSYSRYFNKIKHLYPHEKFKHHLIGDLFKISKSEKCQILSPKKINHFNRELSRLGYKLAKLLRINKEYVRFGGGILLNEGYKNLGDVDIIIFGLKNNRKASISINRLLRENKFFLNEPNSLNRRRFRYRKNIICPFGVYKSDNLFENNFLKKESPKEIFAEVIDNSHSLFSPAVYKILIDKKIGYLVSYFVGHVHLLNIGDKIKFRAPLCFFNNKKILSAYIIPIQGSWIEILSS